MISGQKTFSAALLLTLMLFPGLAVADATSITPRLIAVGSSHHMWALDAACG